VYNIGAFLSISVLAELQLQTDQKFIEHVLSFVRTYVG